MIRYTATTLFDAAMSAVFAALAGELGRERWDTGGDISAAPRLPRVGLAFGYRRNRRLYSGEVLECLRPVSLVIVERFEGPAGSICARQSWRLHSAGEQVRLIGELRAQPNRFARLQQRFWRAHFITRMQRSCHNIERALAAQRAATAAQSATARAG